MSPRAIVPLKQIEYGVHGDLITYPEPYSIYFMRTIGCTGCWTLDFEGQGLSRGHTNKNLQPRGVRQHDVNILLEMCVCGFGVCKTMSRFCPDFVLGRRHPEITGIYEAGM